MWGKLALTLAIASVAVGVAASPASASEFEASNYPVAIKGEGTGTHTLKLGSVEVSCKVATMGGELLWAETTLGVAPEYNECTAGGKSATLKANGCVYLLAPASETAENQFGGTMSISCPTGSKITFVGYTESCEAQIGTQSGLSTTTFEDSTEATPRNITVEGNTSEIKYTVTKDKEEACPFSGTGEKTGGTLVGNTLLTGTVEAVGTGIDVVAPGDSMLCQQLPAAPNDCAAGKAYMAGETVKGSSPAKNITEIFVMEGKNVKNTIQCTQTDITIKTKEEEGNPLNVELTVTFGANTCKATGKGTACTTAKMQNTPVAATMTASGKDIGFGLFRTPVALRFECGTELNCEFASALEVLSFQGGNATAVIKSLGTPNNLKAQGLGGKEIGCFDSARWFSVFNVSSPKAVWPSR